MTIKELILRALQHDPLSESAAQRILLRILEILSRGHRRELPEPNEDSQ